jgi:DNA-directed RNA polymerase sigma subunit (sigma70/sigma32)
MPRLGLADRDLAIMTAFIQLRRAEPHRPSTPHYQQLADQYGLSRMRIRQICQQIPRPA